MVVDSYLCGSNLLGQINIYTRGLCIEGLIGNERTNDTVVWAMYSVVDVEGDGEAEAEQPSSPAQRANEVTVMTHRIYHVGPFSELNRLGASTGCFCTLASLL